MGMTYAQTDRFTLHQGDNRDVLKELPDNSIDSIVTDPPYELGFMGKSWDASGIAFNVEVWQECLRVLKPGGHLLAFSGSRTYHRMAVAIEDAGFEIRDQIMWIYGSGFPKSHDVQKAIKKSDEYGFRSVKKTWQGWGTALKPAHEPIVVARKPLVGTVAANVLNYGTGGLNIDGARVGTDGGTKLADEDVAESSASKTVTAYGNGLGGPFGKPVDGLGRWPANVIHDGSDEVVELFPDTGGGSFQKSSRKRKGFMLSGSEDNVQEANAPDNYGDSGSAARFFYCAKASKRDRNEGLDGFEAKQVFGDDGGTYQGLSNSKLPSANHHPTVKPTALMQYLCKLVTPPGGVVLDPFAGSGSTGKAAMYEGFNFVGIEMTGEYLPIAKARIQYALDEESEKLPDADVSI